MDGARRDILNREEERSWPREKSSSAARNHRIDSYPFHVAASSGDRRGNRREHTARSAGVAMRGEIGNNTLPDADRIGRNLARAYASRGAALIEEKP
jgi:hypothetical protein